MNNNNNTLHVISILLSIYVYIFPVIFPFILPSFRIFESRIYWILFIVDLILLYRYIRSCEIESSKYTTTVIQYASMIRESLNNIIDVNPNSNSNSNSNSNNTIHFNQFLKSYYSDELVVIDYSDRQQFPGDICTYLKEIDAECVPIILQVSTINSSNNNNNLIPEFKSLDAYIQDAFDSMLLKLNNNTNSLNNNKIYWKDIAYMLQQSSSTSPLYVSVYLIFQIDESVSMDTDEFAIFYKELKHLTNTCPYVRVLVESKSKSKSNLMNMHKTRRSSI